jgi:hypothetical protein
MAMLNTEVYDAFVSTGAKEDKARQAAQAIAGDVMETREGIAQLKTQLVHLDEKFESRFKYIDEKFKHLDEKFDAKMEKINWMFGTVVVLSLGILTKLFLL